MAQTRRLGPLSPSLTSLIVVVAGSGADVAASGVVDVVMVVGVGVAAGFDVVAAVVDIVLMWAGSHMCVTSSGLYLEMSWVLYIKDKFP